MKQGFVKVASRHTQDPGGRIRSIMRRINLRSGKRSGGAWSKDRSVSGIMYYRIHL